MLAKALLTPFVIAMAVGTASEGASSQHNNTAAIAAASGTAAHRISDSGAGGE